MDWTVILYAIACIFGAGVVRGYSGFGFSLLAVTSLALVLDPREIVPSIFLLEIAASLHLLPSIWRDVHWRSILPLVFGCALATPLGVWFLAHLPAPPMQLGLAVFVLASSLLLWRGKALTAMPGPLASAGVGAASGLFNGAFGIGGPPVILFYLSSPAAHAVGRASIIAYFLAIDAIGLVFLAREGLVTADTAIRAALFLPALLAGVWLGARSFASADQAAFRLWVLRLLALLALLTGAKGVAALLAE